MRSTTLRPPPPAATRNTPREPWSGTTSATAAAEGERAAFGTEVEGRGAAQRLAKPAHSSAATSAVVAVPPRSRVRGPSPASICSIAASTAAAASSSRGARASAPRRIAPIGLAIPLRRCRRRAVHRLEHRRVLALGVQVARRRDADRARHCGGQVAESSRRRSRTRGRRDGSKHVRPDRRRCLGLTEEARAPRRSGGARRRCPPLRQPPGTRRCSLSRSEPSRRPASLTSSTGACDETGRRAAVNRARRAPETTKTPPERGFRRWAILGSNQ